MLSINFGFVCLCTGISAVLALREGKGYGQSNGWSWGFEEYHPSKQTAPTPAPWHQPAQTPPWLQPNQTPPPHLQQTQKPIQTLPPWQQATQTPPNLQDTQKPSADIILTTEVPTVTTESYQEIRDRIPECQAYNPQPPNFAAPGRRISHVKCLEYIWQIRVRQEVEQRATTCSFEVMRIQGTFGIAAVGGRDTLPGEFPHMGAIGWRAAEGTWLFLCGGSLISSKFVMTAGHCVKASAADTRLADPVPQIVRLGDKNIADVISNNVEPVDANILRIIPHPLYKSPGKYNDIALIELEQHVEFTDLIHPGCLWGIPDISSLGKEATLTGWGVVETTGRKTSPELQAAVVGILASSICDRLLKPYCNRNWCGMQEHQICAGNLSGGVDACQGDSGGPLQMRIKLPDTTTEAMHHIIGVTSFGIGCAKKDLPGVYTRVSSFIDWIESVVWR